MQEATVPELLSLEEYDEQQAKWTASVLWLLARAGAYELADDVRNDKITDLIFVGLTGGDFYCNATVNILGKVAVIPQGISGVLALLKSFGYEVDVDTDSLQSINPIHRAAHLSLIDKLMDVHASVIVSEISVTNASRKFTDSSIFRDQQRSPANVLLSWVNEVCQAVASQTPAVTFFPSMSDMGDIGDGQCLACVLSYYLPQTVPVTSIEFGEHLGVADSLYNLHLVCRCCDKFTAPLLHLTLMDLFYCPSSMRINVMALLTDLIAVFESQTGLGVLTAPSLADVSTVNDRSKLLSQLNFLRPACAVDAAGGGMGDSGGSTSSDEYKTPTFETAPDAVRFDFNTAGSESDSPPSHSNEVLVTAACTTTSLAAGTSAAPVNTVSPSSIQKSAENSRKRDTDNGCVDSEMFLDSRLSVTLGRTFGKKTTFAPLPNQTTWMQERVLRSASDRNIADGQSHSDSVMSASQLVDIRLRLEERRRQIEAEKHRMATQWTRQRQKVSSDAFMQVVSKTRQPVEVLSAESHSAGDLTDSGVGLERQAMDRLLPDVKKRESDDVAVAASKLAEPSDGTSHVSFSTKGSSGVKPIGASGRERGDYSTSLDRLNSSLMELQGEIMRLSLQQDQIKSLVGPESSSVASAVTGHLATGSAFFLSSGRDTVASRSAGSNATQQTDPVHGSPGYVQYDSSAIMLPPYSSIGVDTSYSLVPHMPSTHLNRLSGLFNHHPSVQSSQSLRLAVSSHAPPVTCQSPPIPVSLSCSPAVSQPAVLNSHPITVSSSPLPCNALSAASCVNAMPSSTLQQDAALNTAEPIKAVEQSVAVTVPNAAFFMTFDDNTAPKRAKPVLGAGRASHSKAAAESIPATCVASESVVLSADASAKIVKHETPAVVSFPAVGFTVGVDGVSSEPISELEQRRQKVLNELQAKRKAELEKKKLLIEADQSKKREAQRMKQEAEDQHRAEDRARRDAIFQKYLQRKIQHQDDEVSSGSNNNGSLSCVNRRQKASRSSRPKSQPPPTARGCPAQQLTSQEYVSAGTAPHDDSSQSDLGSEHLHQNFHRDGDTLLELGIGMALAGCKQPWHLLPDRLNARLTPSSSDGSEQATANPQLEYSGPKLFAKPNQKSNRHIMINAVKDCCLAGHVNRDIKEKVLEEISKSESKHFIILFRDVGMQYRGLYTYNPDRDEVYKIHGVGPRQLTDRMMEHFYKYNSGAKNFSEVTTTKHLSTTIDAVAIFSSLWQKKPAAKELAVKKLF